jgi:glycosyltransferase involved in cell wall biosynthesis
MPERRIRILFVIAHLVQSGSERFTYELARALDRSRFEVEVLTKWRVRPNDYYYARLREAGIRVHRRLPILLNRLQRHARPLYLRFRPALELFHRIVARVTMGNLLDRYDLIFCVQIENYYLLQPLLADNERVVTSLMNAKFQYRFDPYVDTVPGRSYRFVIFDPAMVADYRDAPCRDAKSYYLPLTLDLAARPDLSDRPRLSEPYDVGVFIRLSPDRAFSGLFRALQRLSRTHNVRLRIWGRGNPGQFAAELEALGIADRVIFEGHSSDLCATLRDAGLSLVWMTSHGATIGYASIEVASYAFPMLFWNISPIPDADALAASDGAIHSHIDPGDLADATAALLQRPGRLREIGHKLRDHVLAKYDIRQYTPALENYLAGIAARTRAVD